MAARWPPMGHHHLPAQDLEAWHRPLHPLPSVPLQPLHARGLLLRLQFAASVRRRGAEERQ
eukprot:979308-Heterocapsa_arctica.AAC.1